MTLMTLRHMTLMTSMTCDTYGMWNEIEFEMLECWNVGMLEMLEWDSKWNGTKSGMGLKSFPV